MAFVLCVNVPFVSVGPNIAFEGHQSDWVSVQPNSLSINSVTSLKALSPNIVTTGPITIPVSY
jgi:hypothetical protein